MAATFADQLKLFALSVDVIGTRRFNRIANLIERYCRDSLEINSVKFLLAGEVDGQPSLRRITPGSLEIENVFRVRDAQRGYNGQTAFAFDRQRPLWVVSASGNRRLDGCDKYKDLWSGLGRSLPKFRAIGGARDGSEPEIRTSIILPLWREGVEIGVINFETDEYLEITEDAKSELLKIAETVGMLLALLRVSEVQTDSTEQALAQLDEVLKARHPKLTKPKVFIASAHNAEADVVAAVLATLREFGDRLDPVFWQHADNPGNISDWLVKAIGDCRFAVCYLSEKTEGGGYLDNPNVLFEAGMFHGRQDGLTMLPASWIPVREQNSPAVPFDFSQERMITVERNRNGGLKSKLFVGTLRRRIEAMIF